MKGYKASLSKINLGAMFILIYALLGLAVRGGMEYIININQHRNTLRFFTTDFISPIYKDFTISLGALILVATSIMLISKVSKAKLVIPSVMMYALMLTNLICDCCEIIFRR